MGKAQTHHSDFCLLRVSELITYFPQAFCQLVRILHLFRGEVPSNQRRPSAEALAHTMPHTLPFIIFQTPERSPNSVLGKNLYYCG